MITLFDKETGKGKEEFSKFKAFNIEYVDIVDGEVYACSEYDLLKDFDEYTLSLI